MTSLQIVYLILTVIGVICLFGIGQNLAVIAYQLTEMVNLYKKGE